MISGPQWILVLFRGICHFISGYIYFVCILINFMMYAANNEILIVVLFEHSIKL